MIAVEMHFLPTVYVTCDVCNGKRFMKETLEVTFRDKSIFDVLEMTVEDAIKFFEDIPSIHDRLITLQSTGLGYLTLGQSATTLSGGEAQRVKIASEFYRTITMKTLYLLDEPTVGPPLRGRAQAHRDPAGAREAREHGGRHRAQS